GGDRRAVEGQEVQADQKGDERQPDPHLPRRVGHDHRGQPQPHTRRPFAASSVRYSAASESASRAASYSASTASRIAGSNAETRRDESMGSASAAASSGGTSRPQATPRSGAGSPTPAVVSNGTAAAIVCIIAVCVHSLLDDSTFKSRSVNT